MSTRLTMTSRTVVSPNSTIEWISARSSSPIEPSASPTSAIDLMSSEESGSASCRNRAWTAEASPARRSASGVTRRTSGISSADTLRANGTGWRLAISFGAISLVTRRTNVSPTTLAARATHGSHASAALAASMSWVDRIAAPTLTTVLSRRIAASSRRGRSSSARTRAASVPASACRSSRSPADTENRATSDPENRADRASRSTNAPI